MTPLPSPAPPREPHLLRFRLRQLLLFVAGLSALMTLLVRTEGPWPLVIGVTTLLVAAHVFSTMVGTRLRDTSQDVRAWRAATGQDDLPRADMEKNEVAEALLPPTTPLADHGQVGSWLPWMIVGGALLGALLGGILLGMMSISWAGWAVGTISCTVLGTWLAFLAGSFGSIARHAWRHASEQGD